MWCRHILILSISLMFIASGCGGVPVEQIAREAAKALQQVSLTVTPLPPTLPSPTTIAATQVLQQTPIPRSLTPSEMTPTPSQTPIPTLSLAYNYLLPPPQLDDEARKFWQGFLDTLNAKDRDGIAQYIGRMYVTKEGLILDRTPNPPLQVADFLLEAVDGGTVACIGFYSAKEILLSFPKPLYVPSEGEFGRYLVFRKGRWVDDVSGPEKIIFLSSYPTWDYKAFWPCDLAGLTPTAEPDIHILRPTKPREDATAALKELGKALVEQRSDLLARRLLPVVLFRLYAVDNGPEVFHQQEALKAILSYGGPPLLCLGTVKEESSNRVGLLLANGDQYDPFLLLYLAVDNDGYYKVATFYTAWRMSPISPLDLISLDKGLFGEPLLDCPDTVPSARAWPEEERPCIGAPRRLTVGQAAQVCTEGEPLILRKGPGKRHKALGHVPSGSTVWILGGPTCDPKSGMWYWSVKTQQGRSGWVAEGGAPDEDDPFYLCPKP